MACEPREGERRGYRVRTAAAVVCRRRNTLQGCYASTGEGKTQAAAVLLA